MPRYNDADKFEIIYALHEALEGKDTNVLSNDCISRQAAIDEIVTWLKDRMTDGKNGKPLTDRIKDLPSAESEIIWCKDCRHNGSFDTDCPIDWDGKEYCSFAERRTDG